MADGVDHIDIYADVGEEFNQVRKGPGSAAAAPADGAAAWTLAGAAAGREPARVQTVRPWRLRAAPPSAASPRPLFSRVVLRVAGSGARAAAAVQPPPQPLPRGGLTPHCWRRRRALPAELGRVCGAGRTGRRAPSPAARRRGSPGRARALRLLLGPAARVPIPPRRSILCLCPRTVASWKAAFTSLCIPRAGSRGFLLAFATGFGVAPGPDLRGEAA